MLKLVASNHKDSTTIEPNDMKIAILITGLALIGGLIFFLTSFRGQSSKEKITQTDTASNQAVTQDTIDNPFNDLRNMAFNATGEQLGLENLKGKEVFGVIMDWDLGEGIMTLITYQTGDASMYLSTGGGVIGGVHHENVNAASKRFVEQADKNISKTTETDLTPIPDRNCVRFYFLTNSGKYFAQEQMTNFENETSIWLDYFNEANNVITELRLTVDMK